MSLTTAAEIFTIVSVIGGAIYWLYKRIPKLKVVIKPIADHINFGWNADNDKAMHRMQLRIFNHGFTSATLLSCKLKITVGYDTSYKSLSETNFLQVVSENSHYEAKFLISQLHLSVRSELRVIIKDSKGRTYKSNSVSFDKFNPMLNPL